MSGFVINMDLFLRKLQGHPTKMLVVPRKIALELFARVIMKTPVDTGRARGNWQCTIGTPATGEVEEIDQGGVATFGKTTSTVMGWNPLATPEVCLSNNLPYIGKLEEGSSRQAPQGMLRVTLKEYPFLVADAMRDA